MAGHLATSPCNHTLQPHFTFFLPLFVWLGLWECKEFFLFFFQKEEFHMIKVYFSIKQIGSILDIDMVCHLGVLHRIPTAKVSLQAFNTSTHSPPPTPPLSPTHTLPCTVYCYFCLLGDGVGRGAVVLLFEIEI